MAAHSLSDMVRALSRLETAVEAAATSIHALKVQDTTLLMRIASYKEIIRRQHDLIAAMRQASERRDWKEVSRITNLVQGASLMIQVDAGFLVSTLKQRTTSHTSAH
jgi:hypothetical protein